MFVFYKYLFVISAAHIFTAIRPCLTQYLIFKHIRIILKSFIYFHSHPQFRIPKQFFALVFTS